MKFLPHFPKLTYSLMDHRTTRAVGILLIMPIPDIAQVAHLFPCTAGHLAAEQGDSSSHTLAAAHKWTGEFEEAGLGFSAT